MKKLKKLNITSSYLPIILLGGALAVAITLIIFALRIGGAQANELIVLAKTNYNIIFTDTINGTMIYVPVSDTEGIAEATGTSGSKGYYLFTTLGDTVTLSDDIMINQQQNLYDMMLSMIETGITIKKEGYYVTSIHGTEAIMKLMTEKWGLSQGQTMGALNNYEADKTADTTLELMLKKVDATNLFFTINIYVEDKAYTIYNGCTLANSAYELLNPIPVELYNYRVLEGFKISDERVLSYLELLKTYFKEVAELITKSANEGEINQ